MNRKYSPKKKNPEVVISGGKDFKRNQHLDNPKEDYFTKRREEIQDNLDYSEKESKQRLDELKKAEENINTKILQYKQDYISLKDFDKFIAELESNFSHGGRFEHYEVIQIIDELAEKFRSSK